MKGIILAGGKGTRVYPMSEAVPKSLLPVYDKPLIYYPLTTLIENGVKDICIISSMENIVLFRRVLGTGSRFGVKLRYRRQTKPNGIAEAFKIAKAFIKTSNVALILGDNLFFGATSISRAFREFESGGSIFAYEVEDPTRYGVVEMDRYNHPLSIEEKPENPKSNYAIPGLYLFDKHCIDAAVKLRPSDRGELEITGVIDYYLQKGQLKAYKLNRGSAWLDAGTCKSFNEASEYVKVIERRQGIKIGCPEEAALKSGLISKQQLKRIISKMPHTEYRKYLEKKS